MVKTKLENRRYDLFNPAAMILVIGDPRIALSEASAQAALDMMMLYAQVQGIGSCLWGAGMMILNRNRDVRKRLGLHGHERILGILLLGYSAVEFVNKVEGRTMPIAWNGRWKARWRNTQAVPPAELPVTLIGSGRPRTG
jgi:hypothetical protein